MKFPHTLKLAASLALTLSAGALVAQSDPPAAPRHNATENVMPSLAGRHVSDPVGNRLGTIQRVINKEDQSGPRFVVIRNEQGSDIAVPYENLGMKEPERITLNTTRERFDAAPGWESEASAAAINQYWRSKATSGSRSTNRPLAIPARPDTGVNTNPGSDEGSPGSRQSTGTGVSGSDNTGTGKPEKQE